MAINPGNADQLTNGGGHLAGKVPATPLFGGGRRMVVHGFVNGRQIH
jgi:hypothetical protein